jgi:hypothetical protein
MPGFSPMDKYEDHGSRWLRRAVREVRSVATLLPIMAVVFIAHLVIGIAMPLPPLQVHQGLGFGTFLVRLVAGSQFAASLISRLEAASSAVAQPERSIALPCLALFRLFDATGFN